MVVYFRQLSPALFLSLFCLNPGSPPTISHRIGNRYHALPHSLTKRSFPPTLGLWPFPTFVPHPSSGSISGKLCCYCRLFLLLCLSLASLCLFHFPSRDQPIDSSWGLHSLCFWPPGIPIQGPKAQRKIIQTFICILILSPLLDDGYWKKGIQLAAFSHTIAAEGSLQ